jgi:hypothetical protein
MLAVMALRRSPRFISGVSSLPTETEISPETSLSDVIIRKKRKASNQIATETKKPISVSAEPSSLSRAIEFKYRKDFDFVIGIDEAGRGSSLI